MTMLSFRTERRDAEQAEQWAARLGVDRSELLRHALRLHLARLEAEEDATRWEARPMTPAEYALIAIDDWGPAEDWSDWRDATR